jgi:hypothetical protein
LYSKRKNDRKRGQRGEKRGGKRKEEMLKSVRGRGEKWGEKENMSVTKGDQW